MRREFTATSALECLRMILHGIRARRQVCTPDCVASFVVLLLLHVDNCLVVAAVAAVDWCLHCRCIDVYCW